MTYVAARATSIKSRRIAVDRPSTRHSQNRTSRVARIAAGIALSSSLALVAALPAAPAVAASTPSLPAVALPSAPTLAAPDVSSVSPVAVEELLATVPLADLNAGQLGGLLAQSPGLSGLPAAQLQQALTSSIEMLAGGGATLGQIDNPAGLVPALERRLESLLTPTQLAALPQGSALTTLLTSALGSANASQLLSGLLGSSSNPEALIERVLTALDPQKLDALLGSALTGEAVTKTTAGELASSLGATVHGLAEALGVSASVLPASAAALTAPLSNGGTAAVLLPVVQGAAGGLGGAGGPGGGSGSGSTLAPALIMTTTPPAVAASKSVAGKVKIISRKVRGNGVTVVMQVPGAGRVKLAGSGVKSVSAQTSTAERFTLHTVLTKARVASRRKHRHRHMKVELKASFTPLAGASSSASTAVAFS
jgi:hypothetical protein